MNYRGDPETGQPWLLSLSDQACTSDETSLPTTTATSCADLPAPLTTLSNFDLSNGFLKAKRTLKLGTSLAKDDLLAVFTPDTTFPGFVSNEKYYGGDVDGTGPGVSVTSTFASDVAARYEIQHHFTPDAHGAMVKHTSNYAGFTFNISDEDLDPGTGAVTVRRDTAGVPTSYEYDRIGRLTYIRPTGSGFSRYTYHDSIPTSSALPSVDATRESGSEVLTSQSFSYDALGRLVLETKQLPGMTVFRTMELNAVGWKLS